MGGFVGSPMFVRASAGLAFVGTLVGALVGALVGIRVGACRQNHRNQDHSRLQAFAGDQIASAAVGRSPDGLH